MRSATCSCCGRACSAVIAVLFVTAIVSCSDSSSGSSTPTSNVTVFTMPEAIKAETGAATISPKSIISYSDSRLVLFDESSESLLRLETDGSPVLIADKAAFLATTGGTTVDLGPLHEMRGGQFTGAVAADDLETGKFLRIQPNGTVAVHSTMAQMTLATGNPTAEVKVPRALIADIFFGQDVVGKDLLLFDPQGDAVVIADAVKMATAAGVPVSDAEVAGWKMGPISGRQFAWFSSTATVVVVDRNAEVSRHVDGSVLGDLFPDISDLEVFQLSTPKDSDNLYVLVGNRLGVNPRGLGVGFIPSAGGAAEVFTSKRQFSNLLGGNFDIADFDFIPVTFGSVFYAIDRGTSQTLGFWSGSGSPYIAASTAKLAEVAETDTPQLTVSAPLTNLGVVVFELASERHIRVE